MLFGLTCGLSDFIMPLSILLSIGNTLMSIRLTNIYIGFYKTIKSKNTILMILFAFTFMIQNILTVLMIIYIPSSFLEVLIFFILLEFAALSIFLKIN